MVKRTIKIRRLKNGKFEVSYKDPFSQRRIRKRIDTHTEAKNLERQIQRMYKNTEQEHLQFLTIKELMEKHFQFCQDTRVDERRIPYESFMQTFSNIKILDISPAKIKRWMDELQVRQNYAEITMAHIKGNLNHFFRYLEMEGIIQKSPLSYYKVNNSAPPKKERIFYTTDEIKFICEKSKEYSPEFLYPFIMALVHTGARRSEIIELKWEHIDFSESIIKVTDIKCGVIRNIKMSPQLKKLIECMDHSSKHVFTNPAGEKIGRSQLQRHIESLNCSFHFSKRIQCHAFRHSFAYNFLKKGGQMYELMAILGHKDIRLTINLYGKLRSEDIEDPSPYDFLIR